MNETRVNLNYVLIFHGRDINRGRCVLFYEKDISRVKCSFVRAWDTVLNMGQVCFICNNTWFLNVRIKCSFEMERNEARKE